MRFGLSALAFLAVLAAGPESRAAQRYAAPAGSGTECTQAKPCLLKDAVGKASAGDEVIVTPGAYTLGAPANLPPEASNVQVHGETGGPRPTITGSFPGPVIGVAVAGGQASYLDVSNSSAGANGIVCSATGRVDRVRATVEGTSAAAVLATFNCAVRDSVLRASGPNSSGLLSEGFGLDSTAVARNLTAIATGPESVGILSQYAEIALSNTHTLDLRNAIASGDGFDLRASQLAMGSGKTVVSNSNFDTAKATAPSSIVDGGGNQMAPPSFVNAAADDYREAAGSPTIDAGVADQIGTLDFDGNARTLGAAPDIGAFEFVSSPGAPGQIQSLAVAPKAFRPVNVGEAIFSTGKGGKAPGGATVTYSLSAAASVSFAVQRKVAGRKVKGRCRKVTPANRSEKKCARFKPVKGGFTHAGIASLNHFKFSGRLGGRALKPGSYRLKGSAGGAARRAAFRIVK
jgi:hypothetical protein